MTTDELLQRWSDGSITADELRTLTDRLAEPEHQNALLDDWLLESSLPGRLPSVAMANLHESADHQTQERNATAQDKRRSGWFQWRPMAAAAAGLVLGMFCTSVVFAYTQPKAPVVVTKVLPLLNDGFEAGSQIPAQGIPALAGAWSGDFSRVVVAENGVTPKQGQQMLRFLRADNELSPKNERSYVGSVAQVIDLHALRGELGESEQLMEVSAQFNSLTMRPDEKYEFAVKAGAYQGNITDAPKLWKDHDTTVSRSDRCVNADSSLATWQRVAVTLVVPPDADFLVIECAVALKGEQLVEGVAEFPGHYVDQVEVRLSGSNRAWSDALLVH